MKNEGFCIFRKIANQMFYFFCSEKPCVKNTLPATKSLHDSLSSTRLLMLANMFAIIFSAKMHINLLLSKTQQQKRERERAGEKKKKRNELAVQQQLDVNFGHL